MTGLCPNCGQPWPEKKKRRVCGDCRKPILRHHKFYFDGSSVRHHCCDAPTFYRKEAEPPKTMELLEAGN